MTHAEVDVDCIIFTLRVTNQDQLIVMLLNQYYQEHDFLIIHNKKNSIQLFGTDFIKASTRCVSAVMTLKQFNWPSNRYRFQHHLSASCSSLMGIQ